MSFDLNPIQKELYWVSTLIYTRNFFWLARALSTYMYYLQEENKNKHLHRVNRTKNVHESVCKLSKCIATV